MLTLLQTSLTRAIEHFSKAIDLNPEYAEAYKMRGFVYNETDDLEYALKDLTRTIELNPEDTEAYKTRGIIHAATSRF